MINPPTSEEKRNLQLQTAEDLDVPPVYDAPPLPQASALPRQPSPPNTIPPVDAAASEKEWKDKLKKLDKRIRKYNWTRRQSDEAVIIESMRDLAASHSDPAVQGYWTRRADEFEKAPEANKRGILMDIARGLALLIAAPIAIAGAILVGTGIVIKAGGNFLTGATRILK
ncbi:6PF2K domain-containing protein [Favolaschia claudopus]|uniref:6PF2K domain-containing protein n=1 Tax=Favolaschia claudopus TaxID=2862362 RepID=A0AAW0ECK5_9AGAR